MPFVAGLSLCHVRRCAADTLMVDVAFSKPKGNRWRARGHREEPGRCCDLAQPGKSNEKTDFGVGRSRAAGGGGGFCGNAKRPLVPGWRRRPVAASACRAHRPGRGRDSPQKTKVPVRIDALGTVTPIASVAIKTRVDSEIVGVHFRDGAMVRQGDLLFTLDSRAHRGADQAGHRRARGRQGAARAGRARRRALHRTRSPRTPPRRSRSTTPGPR